MYRRLLMKKKKPYKNIDLLVGITYHIPVDDADEFIKSGDATDVDAPKKNEKKTNP